MYFAVSDTGTLGNRKSGFSEHGPSTYYNIRIIIIFLINVMEYFKPGE